MRQRWRSRNRTALAAAHRDGMSPPGRWATHYCQANPQQMHRPASSPSPLAISLRHARLSEELRELGASCLVAIRDHTVTYLTGYTTMTWKMYSRPIVALLTSDQRLLVLVAETEADSARLRIPGGCPHLIE